ncbi:hypothetical protein SAMN05216201_11190 [Pseudomonas linyingensis]|uniref:Uncharacterized protein n=2 Tax=Pseudomonas linyingensis TaxID=915471 RepID=A0A1H6ZY76_9PSED|nr:hypothetical protein SAMN05216201_11190 [Pseudomonas linyingensis]
MLWVGIGLSVVSIVILVRRTAIAVNATRSFDGFFCVNQTTNLLVEVPGYDFSEDMNRSFGALFAENDAPKKLWDSDPLTKTFEYSEVTGTFARRTTAAGQLVIEATEYYLLEKLSTHLTDFFNKPDFNEDLLTEFSREDVPGIVFKNRFLDTFSRPMHERAAFVDSTMEDKSKVGVVSASSGPGGVQYSKFDLILPASAAVRRNSDHSIEIDTPKFRLKLEVEFIGVNTIVPRGFGRLYLDGLGVPDLQAYKVGINTQVEFKALALFTPSGWQYHMWLDSFLASLEEDFSRDEFFKRIDWPKAITISRVVERTIAEIAKKSANEA